MTMRDSKDLRIWEKSHNLTLRIYRVTQAFPREELYGLASQTRRSCASIPANIAKGCGRDVDGEFAPFLQDALDSASELGYNIMLAHYLSMLDDITYGSLLREVNELKNMLGSFIDRLHGSS